MGEIFEECADKEESFFTGALIVGEKYFREECSACVKRRVYYSP
jgi:hypothetical protein